MSKNNDLALRIARHARGLIAKGWAKNFNALDSHGGPTSVASPEACSFCSLGALVRAEFDLGSKDNIQPRIDIANIMFTHVGGNVASWNDGPYRTKAEVLAAYDHAIAELEARL